MCHPAVDHSKLALLHDESHQVLRHAKDHEKRVSHDAHERARLHWKLAIEDVRATLHAPSHYRGPLSIAAREHMTDVDCFDGERIRGGQKAIGAGDVVKEDEEDLLVITPFADGRLKDVGRS